MNYNTNREVVAPLRLNNNIGSFQDDFDYITDTGNFLSSSPLLKGMSGIIIFCLDGDAEINIRTQRYQIKKDELIVMLPGQPVLIEKKSENFKVSYFVVSLQLVEDVLSGIPRLSPLFFIHMRKKYHYKLQTCEQQRVIQYFRLADSWIKPVDSLYKREYVVNLLRLLYLDLYNNYKSNLFKAEGLSDRRKEQLTYDFFLLVTMYFRDKREIAFYADRLRISPKYLANVIKDISGRSAKEWIVEYVIIEIKTLLSNKSLNIQEIALKTNFSNQASMGRFFKKHTGKSPTEYRMKK